MHTALFYRLFTIYLAFTLVACKKDETAPSGSIVGDWQLMSESTAKYNSQGVKVSDVTIEQKGDDYSVRFLADKSIQFLTHINGTKSIYLSGTYSMTSKTLTTNYPTYSLTSAIELFTTKKLTLVDDLRNNNKEGNIETRRYTKY